MKALTQTSFWARHKKLKWFLRILGAIVALIIIIFCLSKQFANVSENNLPKFIRANIIDPNFVTSLSKFRSIAGHSNPGWPEKCRSMKHYINTYDPTKTYKQITEADRAIMPTNDSSIDIFSPVDGRLSKSPTGEGDDQLNISVDGQRGFGIRFEHVHLDPSIGKFNAKVTAGQKIATIWNGQNFDLSIYYHYYKGDELFSYFQVMPDNIFSAWQTVGATSRDEFVFTKEYRDAHPTTCDNSRPGTPNFLDASGKVTENWNPENFVHLTPDYQQLNQGVDNKKK